MTLVPASSHGGGGSAFSGARLYLSADQSFANLAIIDWTAATVDFDTNGYFALASPTLLTVPAGQDGHFLVGFNTDIAGAFTGTVQALIGQSNRVDSLVGSVPTPSVNNPLMAVSSLAQGLVPAGTSFNVKIIVAPTPATLSGGGDTSFWIVRLG